MTAPLVRTISASEMAYHHLRRAIIAGELLPGEPVKQEDVASQLRLSRAPVREALNQLDREGLVVLRPRRGYIVAALDFGEIEEIFQMRILLEEHAARLATQRRKPEDVPPVRALLRAMEQVPLDTPAGSARWASLNRDFHAALFSASRQPRLCQTMANLRDVVERYVRIDASIVRQDRTAQSEHRAIVDAFEAGDAELAARLSREHCEHTYQRLCSAFNPEGRPDGQAVSVVADHIPSEGGPSMVVDE